MTCGIYRVQGPDGNLYIGQSRNIERRWAVHVSILNAGKARNELFQTEWFMHGPTAFTLSILEVCTIDQLNEREQYWFDQYPIRKYNIASQAGSNRFIKRSAESIQASNDANFGSKRTEEQKERMRQAAKARWAKPEEREKQSARVTGTTRDAGAVAATALANMSKPPRSEESRKKSSDSAKRRWST